MLSEFVGSVGGVDGGRPQVSGANLRRPQVHQMGLGDRMCGESQR